MQRLADTLMELAGHSADQISYKLAARQCTMKYQHARRAIVRNLMAPLVWTARIVIEDDRIARMFQVPRGSGSAQGLATAARAMATMAAPFEATLIEAGMPVDFRARLSGGSSTMLGYRQERCGHQIRASRATRLLQQKLAEGRRVVHALDGLVHAALVNDAQLLRAWNLVKRVPEPRDPGSTKDAVVGECASGGCEPARSTTRARGPNFWYQLWPKTL